jgi:hypothetical protein
MKEKDLRSRLDFLLRRADNTGEVKAAQETYRWFRLANRPLRGSDMLGPYRFCASKLASNVPMTDAILNGIDPGLRERWSEMGSIMIEGLFCWWWDLRVGLFDCPEHSRSIAPPPTPFAVL